MCGLRGLLGVLPVCCGLPGECRGARAATGGTGPRCGFGHPGARVSKRSIPKIYDTYGYGKYPNVITSMEFERILSASGPFEGHLARPSDRTEPKKIAWLQCVGSRDIQHGAHGYCSGVCCMYAIKEAVIAKEHCQRTA